MTEDGMVRWHHQLNGHEFESTLGVRDGQGGLACCCGTMEMSKKAVMYVKSGKSSHFFLIFLFLVHAEECVLGIINLVSSLVRMWVSCHHCFIVWGHVSCLCCVDFVSKQVCSVLWLSKPAFFSDH